MKHLKRYNENDQKFVNQWVVEDYAEKVIDWLYDNEEDIENWIEKLDELSSIIEDFNTEGVDLDTEYDVKLKHSEGINFLSAVVSGKIKIDEIITGLRLLKNEE